MARNNIAPVPPGIGVDANPHRLQHDDGSLDTDAAAAYLREHSYQISSGGLIGRRNTGKSPAFFKIGSSVRYTESALREFLKSVGLSTKGFDKPKNEGRMTQAEKHRRNGK